MYLLCYTFHFPVAPVLIGLPTALSFSADVSSTLVLVARSSTVGCLSTLWFLQVSSVLAHVSSPVTFKDVPKTI